jgi:peptidoglycan biosynthesis protein MviN/MurJ (putative lipid II flippase)
VSLHRLGAVGLALGASAGAWVEWWLLRRALARRAGGRPAAAGWQRPMLAAVALVPAVPAGGVLTRALDPLIGGAPVALAALIALTPALVVLAVAAVLLDLDDLPGVRAVRRRLGARLSRPRRRSR